MPTHSSNVISLPSARPRVEIAYESTDADISAAISRAQKNLLRQQKPDGRRQLAQLDRERQSNNSAANDDRVPGFHTRIVKDTVENNSPPGG